MKNGEEEWQMSLGINRNIVECKSFFVTVVAVTVLELIETLWNVNTEQSLPLHWHHCRELIETLWNVNNKKWGGTWERIKELIETLWNVNIDDISLSDMDTEN